jgi:hypothetical protein
MMRLLGRLIPRAIDRERTRDCFIRINDHRQASLGVTERSVGMAGEGVEWTGRTLAGSKVFVTIML